MQRKVIRTQKNWINGALATKVHAEDAFGTPNYDNYEDDIFVKPMDNKACAWCLLGAKKKSVVDTEADSDVSREVTRILVKAIRKVDKDNADLYSLKRPSESVVFFNDDIANYPLIRKTLRVAKQIAREAA